MFALFNRRSVGIHSIVLPAVGWPQTIATAAVVQWVNPAQTVALSVHFFDLPPDLPTLENLRDLRESYHQQLGSQGGVIELSVVHSAGLRCVKSIFKIPQKPAGTTYVASLTIPFKTCSFVIKVQAVETDPTGGREAMIIDRLLASEEIQLGDEGLTGWLIDPTGRTEGVLMNKAEEERYDVDFPDHPLSLARAILTKIERGLKAQPEIAKLRPFDR